MLKLPDGLRAVRIASLWLLCVVEEGRIVETAWRPAWDGEESGPLRELFIATCHDPMAAYPYVMLRGTPFQRSVWMAAMRVPCGAVVGYGALGRSLGCSCAQAVGQALKRNRVFWFVPCHRVVAANGAQGGYSPGAAIKRRLLDYEAGLCRGA